MYDSICAFFWCNVMYKSDHGSGSHVSNYAVGLFYNYHDDAKAKKYTNQN